MFKKGLIAIVLVFATTLVSAGGMEPGSASGALEVGGYADVLYMNMDRTPESTFVLGHFCLDLAAELSDKVTIGAEIEWARVNPTVKAYVADTDTGASDFCNANAALVCAYMDLTIIDPVTLRAGKFLVPFNAYNTNLYPADVAKLARPPLMNVQIVPTKWAETGIQVYGDIETGTAAELDYAVYLVNGLEAKETIGVGLDYIPEMKNNDIELNSNKKAVGARLGIATSVGFEVGLSGYKGAYSLSGSDDLTLLGLDACYAYEAFEVRGEYVSANQDGRALPVSNPTEKLKGFYLQGAYKFLEKYEVVLRYGEMDLGKSKSRFTLGGNYTITDDLTFRVSYEWQSGTAMSDLEPVQNGVVGQLAVRF